MAKNWWDDDETVQADNWWDQDETFSPPAPPPRRGGTASEQRNSAYVAFDARQDAPMDPRRTDLPEPPAPVQTPVYRRGGTAGERASFPVDMRRRDAPMDPRRTDAPPPPPAKPLPLLEQPDPDPITPATPPMITPEYVADLRSRLASVPPESRMAALQGMAQGQTVTGRAARQLLDQLEQERASQDAMTRDVYGPTGSSELRDVLRKAPPGMRFGGNDAPPPTAIPDITPTFPEIADRVSPAERAADRMAGSKVAGVARDAFMQRDYKADIDEQRFAEQNPTLGALKSGAARQMAGLLNAVPTVMDFAARMVGADVGRAPNAPGVDYLLNKADNALPKVAKQEPGQAWDKGEFGEWFLTNLVAQAPQMANFAAAALVPGVAPAALGVMGATSAGESFGRGDSSTAAMLKGGAEVAGEFASLGLFSKTMGLLNKLPAGVGQSLVQNVGKKLAATGAALTASSIGGALEEGATTLMQNGVDRLVEGKDKAWTDGLVASMILGAGMQGPMAIPQAMQAFKSGEQRFADALSEDSTRFDRPITSIRPEFVAEDALDSQVTGLDAAARGEVPPRAPLPNLFERARTPAPIRVEDMPDAPMTPEQILAAPMPAPMVAGGSTSAPPLSAADADFTGLAADVTRAEAQLPPRIDMNNPGAVLDALGLGTNAAAPVNQGGGFQSLAPDTKQPEAAAPSLVESTSEPTSLRARAQAFNDRLAAQKAQPKQEAPNVDQSDVASAPADPAGPTAGRSDQPVGGIAAVRPPAGEPTGSSVGRAQPGDPQLPAAGGDQRTPGQPEVSGGATGTVGDERVADGALSQAPTLLVTGDGQPYGTRSGAYVRSKKEGGEVVAVPGGWAVQVAPTAKETNAAQAASPQAATPAAAPTATAPAADLPGARSAAVEAAGVGVPEGINLTKSQRAEVQRGGNGMAGELGASTLRSLVALRTSPNTPEVGVTERFANGATFGPAPAYVDIGKGFQIRAYKRDGSIIQDIKLPNGMAITRGLRPNGEVYGQAEGDYAQIVKGDGFAEAEKLIADYFAKPQQAGALPAPVTPTEAPATLAGVEPDSTETLYESPADPARREAMVSRLDTADATMEDAEGNEPPAYAGWGRRMPVEVIPAGRNLQTLVGKLDAGKIAPGDFEMQVRMLANRLTSNSAAKADNRITRMAQGRERGADLVRERLLAARRRGDLDPDTVELGLWALGKNPAMAEGLGMSVRAAPEGSESSAGDYNPASSVMRLFKGKTNTGTAVHEVLHHTERMMPGEVQDGIRTEWSKSLAKALKGATPAQRAALANIPAAMTGGQAAQKALTEAFRKGVLDYDAHYPLTNPSEFWAVNATRIMEGRYEAQGSWVATAKQWLKEMVQKVKGLVGMRSDAPVLRGLEAVLASDGSRQSKGMLSEVPKGGVLADQAKEAAPAKDEGEQRVGNVELHSLNAQRGERVTSERTRLTAAEKAIVKAAAAESSGKYKKTAAEFEQIVRDNKGAHPAEDGWAQLVLTGHKLNKDNGKVELVYQTIPYSFNQDAAGKTLSVGTPEYASAVAGMANGMVREVREVYARAKAGDQAAKNIIAQSGWYKEMRTRLRREFGGLGDLFADLLGATSPNTPVRTNWDNSVEFLRKLSAGDYDTLMPKWADWASKADEVDTRFRAFFDEKAKEGLTKNAIYALPEYKALEAEASAAREFDDELLPLKENGKKFGFNGRNAVRAALDLWRVVKNADPDINRGGTAPKAINFSGNLIGFRARATIDVWAARMLERLYTMQQVRGGIRIPSMAEGGVTGEALESGENTLQFGFGQDVFSAAALAIRNDPEMKADSQLASINDDDLQALVWFIEKEVWTKGNWTSAAGEGGSFEFESDLAGVSDREAVIEQRKVADSSVASSAEQRQAAEQSLAEANAAIEELPEFAGPKAIIERNRAALEANKTAAKADKLSTAAKEQMRLESAAAREALKKARDKKSKAFVALTKQANAAKATLAKPTQEDRKAMREGALSNLKGMSRTLDRFVGGVSLQRGAEQGEEVSVPTDEEMMMLREDIEDSVYSGDNGASVIGLKAYSTEGRYGTPERSLDLEAVVRDGFDARPLANAVFKAAAEAKQDSAFLARVLRANESYDPLMHRPGIEIYFRDAKQAEGAAQMMREISGTPGLGGYTVIVDGKRSADALKGVMPEAVGMRIIYLPEFDARYGDSSLVGQSDQQIQDKIEAKKRELATLASDLTEKYPGVGFAGQFWYEVDARFADELQGAANAVADRESEGYDLQPEGSPWRGRTAREAIAAAVGRDAVDGGEQGAELRPGSVYRGDESPAFSRGAGPDAAGDGRQPGGLPQVRSDAPSYGTAREGAVSATAWHFSQGQRGSLSSGAYGRGLKGSSREQFLNATDPRSRKRVYFYVDKGNGINPEAGVGGSAHEVRLNNLYDMDADPSGFRKLGGWQAFESAVADAGFDGYLYRAHNLSAAAVLIGDHSVPVAYRGLGKAATVPGGGVTQQETEPQWEVRATGTESMLQAKLESMQRNPSWAKYDMRVADGKLEVRKQADDTALSRGDTSPGLDHAAVIVAVDNVRAGWSNGPDVTVARNMNDSRIPAAVRAHDEKMRSQGASGDVKAFFYNGKVYVLSNAVTTERDAVEALNHEALGHFGLRGRFGPELDKVLDQVAALSQQRVRAKAKEYGLDPNSLKDRRIAAEEVLAEMAQSSPELSLVRRAIAAIRSWARENIPGFDKMGFTDDEMVRSFIEPARAFVQRGGRAAQRDAMPAFQRQDRTIPAATDTRRYQNLEWEEASDDMQTAELGNGWVASILQNDDGTAQFTILMPNGADFGEPRTYAHIGEARLAAPALLARSIFDDGRQPGDAMDDVWSSDADAMFSRGRGTAPGGWVDPAKTRTDNIIYQLQDKNVDLKRVTQAIKDNGQALSDRQDGYLREELYHGRVSNRVQKFMDGELKPLLMEMRMAGVKAEALEEYLHARHAEERNAAMMARNPTMANNTALSGMSDQDAKAILQAAPPAMVRLAARVDAMISGTRDLMEISGIETAATVQSLRGAYQNYVPLYREDADSDRGPSIGQGFSVKGSVVKSATGSNAKVEHILARIAMEREAVITRAEKNLVGLAVYSMALQNPNPGFWEVDTPPKVRVKDERTGLVVERTDPNYKRADNVMIVKLNGEDRSVIFNEGNERAVRMAKSMKNLDAAMGDGVLRDALMFVGKGTRWIASVNTQYNPVFAIVNAVRDVQGAMVNLTDTPIAGKQAQVMAGAMPALKAVWAANRNPNATGAWADVYREFAAAGGQTGFRELFRTADDRAENLSKEVKKLERGAPRRAFDAFMGVIETGNTAIENAMRVSAYKAARDQGLSKDRAASVAKNLTVNFNRKGAVGSYAGSLYAFFNAAVQGNARLIQVLKGPKGQAIIAGGIAMGVLQALLLEGLDDDDRENIAKFDKEKNFIIPVGLFTGESGKVVKIPMALGLHVLPNIGRQIAEAGFALGRGDKADAAERLGDLMATMIDSFNPVGSSNSLLQMMLPTVVDPVVQLVENKDFGGNPIYRERSDFGEYKTGEALGRENTNPAYKLASRAINAATGGDEFARNTGMPPAASPQPEALRFLVETVGGGVWREAEKLIEVGIGAATGNPQEARRLPLIGRFYGDLDNAQAPISVYYDNLKSLDVLRARQKGLEASDAPDADERAKALDKEYPELGLLNDAKRVKDKMKDLREERRSLALEGKKETEIKRIEEDMATLMREFNADMREARRKKD